MSPPRLSLVVPLYNEEAIMEKVATALLEEFRAAGESLELILVDNGSADTTGAIIDRMATTYPEVRKVRVEVNQGYGWGVLSGLQAASGTHSGWMAGDGQIAPADVVKVWRKLVAENLDLCKACRVRRQDGFKRLVVTALCNLLFPLFFGVRTMDINGTPKMLRSELCRDLRLSYQDWFLDAEAMIKCSDRKVRMGEVPVTFLPRAGGRSNVRGSTIVEFLRNMLQFKRGGKP